MNKLAAKYYALGVRAALDNSGLLVKQAAINPLKELRRLASGVAVATGAGAGGYLGNQAAAAHYKDKLDDIYRFLADVPDSTSTHFDEALARLGMMSGSALGAVGGGTLAYRALGKKPNLKKVLSEAVNRSTQVGAGLAGAGLGIMGISNLDRAFLSPDLYNALRPLSAGAGAVIGAKAAPKLINIKK